MYWELLLLLGVVTKFSVSIAPTPLPELEKPIHDLRTCYENIASPSNNVSPKLCHNFDEFREEIKKYTEKFAEAQSHKLTNKTKLEKQELNKENIDLLEYAVKSPNYTHVEKNLQCMNLTRAEIACKVDSGNGTKSNLSNSELLEKPKLHKVLFSLGFEYTTVSCGKANITKACVMKEGLGACDDIVKQWTADLFDHSIEKCTNATSIGNGATGKYPLPLLMAFLVMTAISVLALSPASE